jgi:hypothetical protein
MHRFVNYDKIPMMKKTQKTITKVLQGLLVLATLITMIVLGIFLWNLITNEPVEEEPPIVSKDETYEMSVVDYEYFKFDDLDFNVLIAKIKVQSKFEYSIPLSKLKTSENIYLNDIDSFLKALQDSNYKPSDTGLVFSLDAKVNELEKEFTLFIPIRSKNINNLEVSSLVKPYSKLSFDLTDTNKWGDTQKLVIEEDTELASENISAEYILMDYYFQSNFYTMSEGNKETTVDFPTNTKVLGVKLILSNKSSTMQYKISKAKILYSDNQEVDTLDPEILLMYEVNLLTQTITESVEGVLFFLVPSSEVDFLKLNKGELTLILELSNGENVTFTELIGK